MFEATRRAMAARRGRHDPPRRRPRVGMWVVLAVNVVFAWWLVATVSDAALDPVAGGVAGFLILVLWAAVDVICGVLYLVTRPRR